MVHKQKHSEESKQKISNKMKIIKKNMKEQGLERLEALSPEFLKLKLLEYLSEFIIERNKLILARLKEQCTNWFLEILDEDIAIDNTKSITIYEFQIRLDKNK